MALVAENSAERAEQLLLATERLTAHVLSETACIKAREPLPAGAQADEKARLANAYRLELARIKQDPAMLEGADPAMLGQLRRRTEALHEALAAHADALEAVKAVTEGLVHAMAEEVIRQRGGGVNYGARGAIASPSGPQPAILDRSA